MEALGYFFLIASIISGVIALIRYKYEVVIGRNRKSESCAQEVSIPTIRTVARSASPNVPYDHMKARALEIRRNLMSIKSGDSPYLKMATLAADLPSKPRLIVWGTKSTDDMWESSVGSAEFFNAPSFDPADVNSVSRKVKELVNSEDDKRAFAQVAVENDRRLSRVFEDGSMAGKTIAVH